jgi:hypothetical protein
MSRARVVNVIAFADVRDQGVPRIPILRSDAKACAVPDSLHLHDRIG